MFSNAVPGMRRTIARLPAQIGNLDTSGDTPGAIAPINNGQLDALMRLVQDALAPRYEVYGPVTFGGAAKALYTLDVPYTSGCELRVAAFTFTGAGTVALSTDPNPAAPGTATELDTSGGTRTGPRLLWVAAAAGADVKNVTGDEWTQLGGGGGLSLYLAPSASGKAVFATVYFRRLMDPGNVIHEGVSTT